MQKNHMLYLGSKSYSRKLLLNQAKIPYQVVEQNADESACDWTLPLVQLIESIALRKMEHVVMPDAQEGQVAYVLTADTMSQDRDGTIQGKPTDYADAVKKIKSAQQGSRLCTSFCLDKKLFKNGRWSIEKRIQRSVQAEYLFFIPDSAIDEYLKNSIGLQCSGAIAIEEYGCQFLKEVHGSYSTIVGLPMFELRESLQEIGF